MSIINGEWEGGSNGKIVLETHGGLIKTLLESEVLSDWTPRVKKSVFVSTERITNKTETTKESLDQCVNVLVGGGIKRLLIKGVFILRHEIKSV